MRDTFALAEATVTLLVNSATNSYLTQISNINGEFTFVIPDSLIGKLLKIRVRCVGFAEKTIVVKKAQLPINDLKIVIEPSVNDDGYFE